MCFGIFFAVGFLAVGVFAVGFFAVGFRAGLPMYAIVFCAIYSNIAHMDSVVTMAIWNFVVVLLTFFISFVLCLLPLFRCRRGRYRPLYPSRIARALRWGCTSWRTSRRVSRVISTPTSADAVVLVCVSCPFVRPSVGLRFFVVL